MRTWIHVLALALSGYTKRGIQWWLVNKLFKRGLDYCLLCDAPEHPLALYHLGVRLSGNYDRATGMGQISGEPPAYGLVRFPFLTGTVYYNLPKAGQLAVDLTRSHYTEEIVPGNNFGAKTLMIRRTKEF